MVDFKKAAAMPSLAAPRVPDRVGTPMPILAGPMGAARGWIQTIASDYWFTPGQPVAPQAPPTTEPRALDYPVGINIMYVPRSEEDTTFQQLRNFSELWDLLRLVIETRKDQISVAEYQIRPVQDFGESDKDYKKRAKDDPKIGEIRQKLQRPDGELTFSAWLRKACEDILVIDALAVLPSKDGLELIDGATIKRLIDNKGRTVRPDDGAAYQQIVKGVPALNLKSGPGGDAAMAELYYFRRNVRTHKLYGYSPVEQIIWTINFACRRALYKMAWYTEGNIPEAFIQVPAEWGLDQVRTFSEWFNSLLAGQVDVRRKAFFLPGVSGKDSVIFPKQDTLKDEMDEWLVRVACYCLSVSPQPFIREMNRATAQTAQEAARAEGLAPILKTLSEWLTILIQGPMGYKDYEFAFSQETEADPLARAQRQALQVRNGIRGPDEVREENGDEPIGVGPGIVTATGFVELETARDQAEAELENTENPPAPMGPDGKPLAGAKASGDKRGKDTGAAKKDGPVQKVTAADAWATPRGKRRLVRTERLLERFLEGQRKTIAARLGDALDQRRANKASGLMDFVEEAGVPQK